MTGDDDQPPIDFNVEMGPERRPCLKVRVRQNEIPLHLSADQAGQLGHALLAVSALCRSPSPPAEGTVIQNCHFPVTRWGTGYSNSNGLPALVLEIAGGSQLTFQFDPKTARDCGLSLAQSGRGPSEPL